MEKYNKLLRNIAELIEKGLFTSKDLKKGVEDSLKLKMEIIANKLNLVSREEFEVQKKIIEKLQKDLKKQKIKKKFTKAKKFKPSVHLRDFFLKKCFLRVNELCHLQLINLIPHRIDFDLYFYQFCKMVS